MFVESGEFYKIVQRYTNDPILRIPHKFSQVGILFKPRNDHDKEVLKKRFEKKGSKC